MAGLVDSIIGAESSGNPLARNPRSSAGGLGQFIDSTWLATLRKHRPDVAAGKTNAQLLQLKFDPALSREMTQAYASDNQGYLQSRGIDPTPGNTYLAHFAGPQGAAAIHANPNASAEQLLGARAVAANPFLRGKTGADVINWAAGKVGANRGAGDMPAQRSYLAQAINQAGLIPGVTDIPADAKTPIGGAPVAGGPVPLTAPNLRYSKLADALLASAAGAKPRGWGELLNAAGDLALGYTLGNRADEEQKTYRGQIAERLRGITDPGSMADTLMSTGDDDLIKQGVAMKVAQAKENAPPRGKDRYMALPNGQVLDLVTMKPIEGLAAKDDKPIEVKGRLVKLNPQTGKYEEVYAAPPDAEGGIYNKNLVYGEDDEGNPVPMQAGSHGEVVRSKLPEGVKLRREPVKMDGGTHWILLDPTTRQVIGQIPKDVAGEARDKEVGKGQGERMIAQPATNANMRNSLSGLDRLAKEAQSLKAMEGVEGMTGVLQGSGWVPTVRQSTADAEAKLTTLKSQIAFNVLQAMRDASKTGGALGAVSEKELALLENNLAALGTQQDAPSFKGNLDRIVEYAQGAMGRLRAAYRDTYGQDFDESAGAGGERTRIDLGAPQEQTGQPSAPAAGGPVPGHVEDGFRFKGGNPADPNNWEQVR